MPTGVHLADARALLFDAAEAVLRRDGPSGLTSRAVTTEAGVAKGVVHRHFVDFDAFLAELILDRVSRLAGPAERLNGATGAGNLVDNLAEALVVVFSPLTVAEVALVITRDALRERLTNAGAARLPLLGAGTTLVSSYLLAEQEIGRIDATAEPAALAPTLIGALHLLFTEHQPASPGIGAVREVIQTVLKGARAEGSPSTKRTHIPG